MTAESVNLDGGEAAVSLHKLLPNIWDCFPNLDKWGKLEQKVFSNLHLLQFCFCFVVIVLSGPTIVQYAPNQCGVSEMF